ncbi:hypothetical protein PsYK624_026080 [Phanerochaete sordida]|uniref:Uncharacterized protein n=1 Tax=Phanerochaete sordida TaxID=48140 RepID=A0A9P3G1H7_9APHY|nr:hypothetical protein PsYK624_026080 [Phanerochaete sordida]
MDARRRIAALLTSRALHGQHYDTAPPRCRVIRERQGHRLHCWRRPRRASPLLNTSTVFRARSAAAQSAAPSRYASAACSQLEARRNSFAGRTRSEPIHSTADYQPYMNEAREDWTVKTGSRCRFVCTKSSRAPSRRSRQ